MAPSTRFSYIRLIRCWERRSPGSSDGATESCRPLPFGMAFLAILSMLPSLTNKADSGCTRHVDSSRSRVRSCNDGGTARTPRFGLLFLTYLMAPNHWLLPSSQARPDLQTDACGSRTKTYCK